MVQSYGGIQPIPTFFVFFAFGSCGRVGFFATICRIVDTVVAIDTKKSEDMSQLAYPRFLRTILCLLLFQGCGDNVSHAGSAFVIGMDAIVDHLITIVS